MTAKEFLRQLRQLDVMIDQKIQELDLLRDEAMNVKALDFSGDRVQTSSLPDAPYTSTIQKIIDLSAEINADIDRFVDCRHRIIKQIQGLNDQRYSDLLYRRYVKYETFWQIEEGMHYSHSYILALHRHALSEFEKKYLIIH